MSEQNTHQIIAFFVIRRNYCRQFAWHRHADYRADLTNVIVLPQSTL